MMFAVDRFYRQLKGITAGMVLVFFLFGMVSCSGLFSNYGTINLSEKVTGGFEGSAVNGEYRYFISGSDLYPNAILGLRSDVRLDTRTLWREVTMTPVRMKELVEGMTAKVSELNLNIRGYELTTPGGQSIGVWYSIPTASTMVRMNEDGAIWIETPDIDTYEKFEVENDPK
jgi:hypothetical protein